MGRKAKFNVESLEIGQKMPFPKTKGKWIWQYLRNFNSRNEAKKYGKIEENGMFFITRLQ